MKVLANNNKDIDFIKRINGCEYLFAYNILPGLVNTEVAINTSVDKLGYIVNCLEDNKIRVKHIYDF